MNSKTVRHIDIILEDIEHCAAICLTEKQLSDFIAQQNKQQAENLTHAWQDFWRGIEVKDDYWATWEKFEKIYLSWKNS